MRSVRHTTEMKDACCVLVFFFFAFPGCERLSDAAPFAWLEKPLQHRTGNICIAKVVRELESFLGKDVCNVFMCRHSHIRGQGLEDI